MDDKVWDVLIIGSGIAGLSAAVRLARKYDVLLVTKGKLYDCNTDIAQGGIAVALGEEDSPFTHFQDTMSAGDYLCREDALKVLVEEGPVCVKELIDWGANFDREGENLDFAKEGAHTIRRILHAHGDATGHEIEKTLLIKVREFKNVYFLENTICLKVEVKNNVCWGAICFDNNEKKILKINSRVLILATGGAGQLYMRTTNSLFSTGDGHFLGFDAGAILEDMEFVQFHPTAFAKEGAPTFLLTEAMRGEGGILRNNKGERFVYRYHPLGELAPRDIVSRAIFTEMKESGAQCVYLDMTHFKRSFLENRFPTLFKKCLEYGIDISKDYIPVAPAAHYIMGGIKTDTFGRTTVKNLFACGECACTGVHGANRLASNSLLEGLVFGKRLGGYLLEMDINSGIKDNFIGNGYFKEDECPFGDEIFLELKKRMWYQVGIIRDEEGLKSALSFIREKLDLLQKSKSVSCRVYEMIFGTAYLITLAALNRRCSRGGHFRSDFPTKGECGNMHLDLKKDMGEVIKVFWEE